MTLLLDANVLLALAWPNHPFHRRALARLDQRGLRWATCLLTQTAFVRLSANPAVVTAAKSPSEAWQMLQTLTADSGHIFLEAKNSQRSRLSDLLRRCHGHNQVNDAFLVWLAATRGATLLTFDKGVEHLASTPDTVEVLS
ncbi:MAG: TA system VapC family ribonuclease toxin [Chthoniobacterales bacterium]